MILIVFIAFLALAAAVTIIDWRHGVPLLILTGVLQDPARKLTTGEPVALTMSVIVVYLAIIIATQARLQRVMGEFAKRFAAIWGAFGLAIFFIALAAVNGLITNGIGLWRVPMISLFIYLAPLPAVLIGYLYIDREETLYRFLAFYSIVTSAALIGTVLEYLRFDWRVLGMVHQTGDYLRYLPGMEIRMLSGFYRGPDIMAWHAATLACIGIAMVVRAGIQRSALWWSMVASWGCFNAIISGRRKAIYFIAVFAAVFLWRYFRQLKTQHVVGFVVAAMAIAFVVHEVSSHEESSVYTRAALTTQREVTDRLEGGLFDTIQQFGYLGAGLGVATQGAYHVTDDAANMVSGWQEGGLGKLAVELGVPGLLAVAFLVWRVFFTMNRIARFPDLPGTSQLARAMLFAMIIANIANFAASAQAYSDPVLTLLTAFFAGCLFATSKLDEQQPALAPEPEPQHPPLAVVTA
ncbi:MAG TPA: hypothetical protein VH087_08530 [Thermoanaerobaculia bacterium]|jgi:hypothetical protein|nr:hypothetical protein [Thermoanaerobaculia bacterium]